MNKYPYPREPYLEEFFFFDCVLFMSGGRVKPTDAVTVLSRGQFLAQI
jgi:hypothetical protein